MWKYFGVFCNTLTVLLGGSLGLLMRARSRRGGARPSRGAEGLSGADALPEREGLPDVMMVCLGFCTIFAAASGLLGVEGAEQALIVVGSMVAGLLIGWALRIDDRLGRLGDRLLLRFSRGGAADRKNPAEGLVTATLLFCVGSMTFLGSFESAANPPDSLELGCHTTMLIKSLLDFVSSTCLAVSFGASVLGAAVCVLVFQGALVALASTIEPFLERIGALPVMSCVGSLVLLAIALNLLGLKKIKTADYLPALLLPIPVCWLLVTFS